MLDVLYILAPGAIAVALICWVVLRAKQRDRNTPFDILAAMAGIKDPFTAKDYLEVRCTPRRSYKRGEELTLFEAHWMLWRSQNEIPNCVDCELGDLYATATAATSVNVKCCNPLCGSGFNILSFRFIMRNTDKSPKAPREMTNLGVYR